MTDRYEFLRASYALTTKGRWVKGKTSHHTVAMREGEKQPYPIGEFHHADDAGFCDAAHRHMPALLAERDALYARVQELEASGPALVCYEAYQVVGILLNELGLFDTEQATKILDNLSQARRVHDDVLPWTFECPWDSRQLGASAEHAVVAHKDSVKALTRAVQMGPIDGWQLVPIEPTAAMLDAAHQGDREYNQRAFGQEMNHPQGGADHWAAMLTAAPQPETRGKCWCESCDKTEMLSRARMNLCPDCGNKRCPKATHHDHGCTNSNERGQKGSSWENLSPQPNT